MESTSNSTSSFWWLIAFQSFLCIWAWSALEVLGGGNAATLSILVTIVLVGIIASYKGFYLTQPLKNRIWYVILGQAATVLNVIGFGLILGQLVAMLLGLWSFPPQN